MSNETQLRNEILRLTREYARLVHLAHLPAEHPDRPSFAEGDSIPYAGRVFSADEVEAAVAASLDFWLTLGAHGERFEKRLSGFLGTRYSLLVNSGSSANLVALSALTSHKLPRERRLLPGDEVITVATGFPTTVAPIIQCGAKVVFVDAAHGSANYDCRHLEDAYMPGKTKAVMMAHALGSPFNLIAVLEFCRSHSLWLIEDNCDALGSTYTLPLKRAQELGLEHLVKIAEAGTHPLIRLDSSNFGDELTAPTGSFGDLSTQSFYPPHHITMGEGGAVNVARQGLLKVCAESFRDWGRDCWCPSGVDNTCGKRFDWRLGELPDGYDHKYIYSHLGYNLKPLDIQAAIGCAQMDKLPDFVRARKRNWELLRRGLRDLETVFEFALPEHAVAWVPPTQSDSPLVSKFAWDSSGCRADCSWFGFQLTIKESAPFSRNELARHLDAVGIGNRMVFGGNLLRQPAFIDLAKEQPDAFRLGRQTPTYSPCDSQKTHVLPGSSLPQADRLMTQALFIGTYPGLDSAAIEHVVAQIRQFVVAKRSTD